MSCVIVCESPARMLAKRNDAIPTWNNGLRP